MFTNQASTTSAQRVAIILNSSSDWDEWIEVVRTKALGNDIWEFVNPATAKAELPTLAEPSIPTAADINPAKALDKLSEDEKEQLRLLRYDYKRRITSYDRQKAAIGSLRSFIQETVSRTYLIYTFRCESPYDMLVALKQRSNGPGTRNGTHQQVQQVEEGPESAEY